MKGNGNSFSTLFQKLFFMALPTSGMRSRYIQKHRNEFKSIGSKVFWQPRKYPADPELISIGNNVKISAGVEFINHDIINSMFASMINNQNLLHNYRGCIAVNDNVMIGSNVTIFPDSNIGSNVIVAAGAVVTKDIPAGEIWGGVPARRIGFTDDLLKERMKKSINSNDEELWNDFYSIRNK